MSLTVTAPTPTAERADCPLPAAIVHVTAARSALEEALSHLEPALAPLPHPFPEVGEAIFATERAIGSLADVRGVDPGDLMHHHLQGAAAAAERALDAIDVRHHRACDVLVAVLDLRRATLAIDSVLTEASTITRTNQNRT